MVKGNFKNNVQAHSSIDFIGSCVELLLDLLVYFKTQRRYALVMALLFGMKQGDKSERPMSAFQKIQAFLNFIL